MPSSRSYSSHGHDATTNNTDPDVDDNSSDESTSEAMQKLFADNIRSSPAAAAGAEEDNEAPDPDLTLPLRSASVSAQPQSSPVWRNDWLTEQLQIISSADGATSFSHGEPAAPSLKRKHNPKVLCMGARRCVFDMRWSRIIADEVSPRCGKSSVQKVVFQKTPPADTLYLDATTKIERATMQ